MPVPPPASPEALLRRAQALAGRTLQAVADRHGIPVPPDLRRSKGFIGRLLEEALGASAGSQAEPDFPAIGVEMKSLPVDEEGVPRESTYVCVAPLDPLTEPDWEQCWVRRKLSHVLWVPVVGVGEPGARRVGTAFLWRPDPDEEAVLRADWEELRELLAMGELWQIDARRGKALQLRPKAASAREVRWMQDQEGEWVRANPLGFYLRRRFTAALLARRLGTR